MITAKEAREEYRRYHGYEQKFNDYISCISDEIFEAARDGKTYVHFVLHCSETISIVNDVIKMFENNGFCIRSTAFKTHYDIYIEW